MPGLGFSSDGGWLERDPDEVKSNLSSVSKRNTSNTSDTSTDRNRLDISYGCSEVGLRSDCVHGCTVWWGQLRFSVCVADVRLTCRAEPSGSLLRLRGSVAALLATFPPAPPGGARGADMHFTDFEERHHERLLLQRTVTSYESRLLGADALPCFRRYRA